MVNFSIKVTISMYLFKWISFDKRCLQISLKFCMTSSKMVQKNFNRNILFQKPCLKRTHDKFGGFLFGNVLYNTVL